MLPIEEVLKAASSRFNPALEPAWDAKIEALKANFDAAYRAPSSDIDCNIFVFHVAMNAADQLLQYPDLDIDLSAYDYNYIISKSLANTVRLFKNIRIVFVTNDASVPLPDSENIIRIQVGVNAAHPVYERVYAMAAYVRSRLFDRKTAFVDSDTFIALNPSPIFKDDFDIGVTVRFQPNFMPFNEGVIFAGAARPALAKAFFNAYAATYEALIRDDFFASFYGDIRRWRGGQLSLNTVADVFIDKDKSRKLALKPRVAVLPVDLYNFSFEENVRYNKAQLDSKFIFHLKGNRKIMVDALLGYLDRKPTPAA